MFKNMRWICNKHDKILDLSNCKGNETLEELERELEDCKNKISELEEKVYQTN